QGNITLGPTAGAPNDVQLVIHNYLKPQDSMTLVFDKQQKALVVYAPRNENFVLVGLVKQRS
ncbi:MAG: hypothetical protein WBQ89_17175, partial [Candidatus Acidiferrum sp.]